MIGTFVEVKRRLAWEARLSRSSLRLEADEGGRPALWVFDSRHGPDGYALRDQMLDLARQERLKLFSFGPRGDDRMTVEGVMRSLDRHGGFPARVACRIDQAAARCGAALFIVGSSRGTFAAMISAAATLWEVQHGLLDPSYLPMRADRFFTRSTTSGAVLRCMAPDTPLGEIGDDLSPPKTRPGDPVHACAVICYSKNPGGGCTVAELVAFERAAIRLADRLNMPFHLKLHPRDNRWKLLARHRRIGVMRHLKPLGRAGRHGPCLVLSSYSTALTTQTRPGDLLLNITLSPPNPIIAAEYSWLPTIDVGDLARFPDCSVMERM